MDWIINLVLVPVTPKRCQYDEERWQSKPNIASAEQCGERCKKKKNEKTNQKCQTFTLWRLSAQTVTKWSPKILDPFTTLVTVQRQAPVLALNWAKLTFRPLILLTQWPQHCGAKPSATLAPEPLLMTWDTLFPAVTPDIWTPIHHSGSRIVVQQANWRSIQKVPCPYSATRQQGQAPELTKDF